MNYPVNTFEKAIRLFGQFSTEYKIEYAGDGKISTYGDNYVMTKEHLFQRDTTNSTYKMEFIMDESGRAERLFIGINSYERISWLERKRVQQPFLFISLLLLLFYSLSRPIQWTIRKIRRIDRAQTRNEEFLRHNRLKLFVWALSVWTQSVYLHRALESFRQGILHAYPVCLNTEALEPMCSEPTETLRGRPVVSMTF